jgi:hypothetical protein
MPLANCPTASIFAAWRSRCSSRSRSPTTTELDSSHVSLVSHPKEIADLILLAAGHKKSQ